MAAADIPVADKIAFLDAAIECAMLMHGAIVPRGFDTRKQREKLHTQIDAMLDERSFLCIQQAIEAAS